MRSRQSGFAALLCGLVAAASLVVPAAAAADSITPISSFTDPRGSMPSRPGQLVKALYGPFTVCPKGTSSGNCVDGQIHNAIDASALAPCTNCRITDMIPNLVYSDGTTANLSNQMMMHHFVLLNPGKQDVTCPTGLQGSFGQRFFAAGNERTQLHLPTPFGYENNNATWYLIYHLVNKSTTVTKTVNIQVVYRYRPISETQPATPLWLDIDNCGDSEYTTPTGYFDATADWTSTIDGRFIGMSGHLHDLDITSANPCVIHCPAEGEGLAVSAEIRGGPSSDYFGPSPPNNPPPVGLTGATACRSEGYYGTTSYFGNPTPWNNHLDTMSQCGIFTDVPAGAQPGVYPASAAYSVNGYPIQKNQVIRLHSEYDNQTGSPQTDVMGIMVAWVAPFVPYTYPIGASPSRFSLVPAFRPCTSPNANHAGPLSASSCSPPVPDSSLAAVGPTSAGFARLIVLGSGQCAPFDPTHCFPDATIRVNVTDVHAGSPTGPDYDPGASAEMTATAKLRITDKNNGPSQSGTVADLDFNVPVSCTSTSDPSVGSTCDAATTANTLYPGAAVGGTRAVWQLNQLQLKDAGADGIRGNTDDKRFEVQGVFAP